MSMRKKCTKYLIVAASSALMASCVSNQSAIRPAAVSRPMLIASADTVSAADLYAQRYASSATQIRTNGKQHFVRCETSCPGATPKTPIEKVMAAVTRRALFDAKDKAQDKAMAAESTSPTITQGATTEPGDATAAEHYSRSNEAADDNEH